MQPETISFPWDDDMQTHPSQIIRLKEKLDEGYDIVYGYYPEKKESLFRRMGSALNHFTVRALIHKPKWLKTSSYWMIRRYVRDYAIAYTHPSVPSARGIPPNYG